MYSDCISADPSVKDIAVGVENYTQHSITPNLTLSGNNQKSTENGQVSVHTPGVRLFNVFVSLNMLNEGFN